MVIALVRRCAAFAVCLIVTVSGAHAAQRTFVSTGGSDANACTLAAPCRAFAKALTVTDVAGEIVVLDSGGYGGVTVNKNVSILSPAGVYAGISVFAATDGIVIAAPATKVVLRGLAINGQGGNNGVRVQAGEVHVEASVISNMTQAGILVEGGTSVRVSGTVVRSNADGLRVVPAAGSVSVLVRDSEFSNQANAGVSLAPSGGTTAALVTVERSSATKNGAGLVATPAGGANATLIVAQSVSSENAGAGVASQGTGASVFVRESAVTRNGTGLLQASSGVLNACGGNLLVANTTAQSGAINTSSCLDVASGAGTVTSVATGAGLSGGPITTGGTINLAATQLLPTMACAPTQIPKWSGSAWACAADNTGVANAFVENGNAFGATAVLGTIDNFALSLKANNLATLTLTPDATSPILLAGSTANSITAGASGSVIAGGGAPGTSLFGTCGSTCANRVTASFGTIGGGAANTADLESVVAGGFHNTATGRAAAVLGGEVNSATGDDSVVAGGALNTASGIDATVAGGNVNVASGALSAIGGGQSNTANATHSTVGGGTGNHAGATEATIAGGGANIANGSRATIGGGEANIADGAFSTIPGGNFNTAGADNSFVAGTLARTRNFAETGTPGGDAGAFVWADSQLAEFSSVASNEFAARAAGGFRFVTAVNGTGTPLETFSIAPGGKVGINTATPESTATLTIKDASGPTIFLQNTVSNAVEAGRIRFADQNGTGNCLGAYVHYDASGNNFFHIGVHDVTGCATTDDVDVINIRRNGGVVGILATPNPSFPLVVGTDTTNGNGAHLTTGGVWTNGSSRTFKEGFEPVDARSVLERVVALPIGTWRYKGHASERHMGPYAEDFHAAFGLGADDRYIGTVDADGVALVAIQGLHQRMEERGQIIDAQRTEIDSMRAEIEALKSAIRQLAEAGTRIARAGEARE